MTRDATATQQPARQHPGNGHGRSGRPGAVRTVVVVISRLGGEARFLRSLFLEEIGKDYVRTARAKGLR